MRQRLLKATLESLAEDGYAGSTLSSIVHRAGVSRGAQVHHYPSKQALMINAVEDLLRQTYRKMGDVLLSIAEEDNRLDALVSAVWSQYFQTPLHRAYGELLVASQHDPSLADAMQTLMHRVALLFKPAAEHYFEPIPNSPFEITTIFMQLYCMLGGLAGHAHFLNDPSQIDRLLACWLKLAAPHLRARKGVRTPPPRPVTWDRPDTLHVHR